MKIKPEKLHPWLYKEAAYSQISPPTDEVLQKDYEDREMARYEITPFGEQLLLALKRKDNGPADL